MIETYNFSDIEIEDLMNNHAYEMAEIIEQTYIELEKELKDVGGFDE